MKVPSLPVILLIASLALGGCNRGSNVQKVTGPQKDALKELIKEDVVIGKPTRFNKGQKPLAKGDMVWVTYTGTFKAGKVFDTNDPKNKEGASALSFVVGDGMMIKAFDEGLIGMYPGGRRKLSVPYRLGYGERGNQTIPPYSDLYFDVVVHDYINQDEQLIYGCYDVKVGTGPVVKEGSTVTLHTVVHEINGKLIEDTRKDKPVTFVQGQESVLRAVDDGIKGMRKGGVRELLLPPAIGFPASTRTGVDGTTMFIVRIELLDVR